MPLYDYECRECGNVHEEFSSFDNRGRKKCRLCGSVADKLPPTTKVHLFKPFNFDVSPMESVKVETKGQLKRLCKEYGKYAPGYDILEHSKEI